MTLGFVGLGQMGLPMAVNLAKAGKPLLVYDREIDRAQQVRGDNVTVADGLKSLGDCETVFLCVPSDAIVEDILFGHDGLATAIQPGTLVVDTSTISYEQTRSVATRLKELGIDFVDAPVSGMAARAIEGTLTIMCGGSRDDVARVQPLLSYMGSTILYMGGHGAGQLTKLINQLLFDINAAALAEILPMSTVMGLDPSKIAKVVNSGTGRSYASEFFLPQILARSFSNGYPLKHAYKDLVSAARLGAAKNIPMPVLAAATATYQQALLIGLGDDDKGAMIKVFERLLGVEFREQGGAA